MTSELLVQTLPAGRFPLKSVSDGNLGTDLNGRLSQIKILQGGGKVERAASPGAAASSPPQPRAINYQEVTFLVNGFNFCFYVRTGNCAIYSTTDCCWFSCRALGLLSASFFPFFFFFSAFPLRSSPKTEPRRLIVGQVHPQPRRQRDAVGAQ